MRRSINIILVLYLMANLGLIPTSTGINQLMIPYTNQDNVQTTIFDDYGGNYVFIDAFATWCESCRISMAHLVSLYKSINNTFPMVSISIDPVSDSLEKIQDYMNEYSAEWDYGIDHETQLKDTYKVSTLPTAFLFNPEGELLTTWIGVVEAKKYVEDINYYIPEFDISLVDEPSRTNNLLSLLFENPIFLVFIGLLVVNSVYLLIVKKNTNHISVNT